MAHQVLIGGSGDEAADHARWAAERLDVVAIGAHPDDVEIGCGGTLAALVRLGYRVGILDLTDGEPTPLSPGPDVRLAEARAAGEALGVSWRMVLDLPNRRLFDSFEARVAIATQLRRLRPRLVLGIAAATPTASPDHWQTRLLVDAAVFYSRLTKWNDQFGGTAPHRIERHGYYPLSFDFPGGAWTEGSMIVQDISADLDTKLRAIHCYQTQFPDSKAPFLERVRGLALACGQAAGFRAGERLYWPTAWGTGDLLQHLPAGDEG